jgi:hypothetical protein
MVCTPSPKSVVMYHNEVVKGVVNIVNVTHFSNMKNSHLAELDDIAIGDADTPDVVILNQKIAADFSLTFKRVLETNPSERVFPTAAILSKGLSPGEDILRAVMDFLETGRGLIHYHKFR